MQDKLQEIVDIAIKSIKSDSTPDQIEKVIGIAKNAADAEKSRNDLKYRSSQVSLEWWKTLPTIIVPIVSIATVLVTIYIQNIQLQLSRQQNEDTQWREFLATIKQSSVQVISDVTFAPRLKSFMHSPIYSSQAQELAKRMMGSVANQGGFEDLFSLVFTDPDHTDLKEFVDVSKNLSRTKFVQIQHCITLTSQIVSSGRPMLGSVCFMNNDERAAMIKGLPLSTDVEQATADLATLSFEQVKISSQITMLIKKEIAQASASRLLSIGGSYIFFQNFAGLDLSNMDLTETILDSINLSGVILKPKKFLNSNYIGSDWWDAQDIDQSLLDWLIQSNYPGFIPQESIVNAGSLTRESYAAQIARLCKPMRPVCQPDHLRFDPSSIRVFPLPL